MSLGKSFQLFDPPSSHLSNTIMLQPQTGDDKESWGPGDITVCNVWAPLPGFGLHTAGVEETLSLPACIHDPCGWTGKACTQQTRPIRAAGHPPIMVSSVPCPQPRVFTNFWFHLDGSDSLELALFSGAWGTLKEKSGQNKWEKPITSALFLTVSTQGTITCRALKLWVHALLAWCLRGSQEAEFSGKYLS